MSHLHKLVGHPAVTRMHATLQLTYYWSKMTANAPTTVPYCVHCAKIWFACASLRKQVIFLELIPAFDPLELAYFDILGPLLKS